MYELGQPLLVPIIMPGPRAVVSRTPNRTCFFRHESETLGFGRWLNGRGGGAPQFITIVLGGGLNKNKLFNRPPPNVALKGVGMAVVSSF